MSEPKYEIGDSPAEDLLCCLNCRQVVETARDWESYTLYCIMCGEDLNDYELYLEDDQTEV